MRKKRVIGKTTKDIAARIRRLREGLGMSQATLAHHVGYSKQYWREIESGKRIFDVGILDSVARTLDVSLMDLLFDIEGFNPGTKTMEAVAGSEFVNAWGDPEFRRLVRTLAVGHRNNTRSKVRGWVYEACRRLALPNER